MAVCTRGHKGLRLILLRPRLLPTLRASSNLIIPRIALLRRETCPHYRKIGTFSSGPLLTLEPRSFLRPRRADSARRFAACPFIDFLVKDVSAKKLVIAQGEGVCPGSARIRFGSHWWDSLY